MKLCLGTLVCVITIPVLYGLENVPDLKDLVNKYHIELLHGGESVHSNQNSYYYSHEGVDRAEDPDVKRNVSQMITSKGYEVEEHTIETADGFLLGVQRIPRGRNNSNSVEDRPAIFLAHGLFSSSVQWVFDFPNQSIAFVLADLGYDVWLGNFRGNFYSRHHIKYNPRQSEFWNYTWDDMALFDIPACIDYIRNVTGQDKIFYAGHSMGTTTILALLSAVPEYNDRLKAVIALAPVANVSHITGALRLIAPLANDFKFLMELFTDNEFFPSEQLVGLFSDIVCGPNSPKILCHSMAFLLVGPDVHLNKSRIEVYLNHFPAGVSAKTIVQYAQCVQDKKFQKYDYGKAGNMERYGQEHPPVYDVTKITAPVGLYSSEPDYLADPIDVADLEAQLSNLIEWYKVPCNFWSHLDFAVGTDAYKCVYQKVIETLNSLK